MKKERDGWAEFRRIKPGDVVITYRGYAEVTAVEGKVLSLIRIDEQLYDDFDRIERTGRVVFRLEKEDVIKIG